MLFYRPLAVHEDAAGTFWREGLMNKVLMDL